MKPEALFCVHARCMFRDRRWCKTRQTDVTARREERLNGG